MFYIHLIDPCWNWSDFPSDRHQPNCKQSEVEPAQRINCRLASAKAAEAIRNIQQV